MKTPYCGVIGLQRREVDQLRTSIGVEVGRLAEVEQRNALIDESVRRERGVAAAALDVPATAYFLRMRAESARLEADRRVIDARVTLLRTQAREAFGSLTVIEGAADRFREEEMRQIEAAQQTVSDDRSATDYAHRVRLARAVGRRRA